MDGYFYTFFNRILTILSLDGIFLILCGVVIISCVVNAVLGRYLNGYTVKKRLWYIAVATFSVLCLCGFCALARVGYVLPFFISAFSCLLFIPVAMAKPKNKDNRKEPKFVQPVCFLSEQMLGMSERENERSVVGRLWVVNFPFLFYNEHMLLLLYYVFF